MYVVAFNAYFMLMALKQMHHVNSKNSKNSFNFFTHFRNKILFPKYARICFFYILGFAYFINNFFSLQLKLKSRFCIVLFKLV